MNARQLDEVQLAQRTLKALSLSLSQVGCAVSKLLLLDTLNIFAALVVIMLKQQQQQVHTVDSANKHVHVSSLRRRRRPSLTSCCKTSTHDVRRLTTHWPLLPLGVLSHFSVQTRNFAYLPFERATHTQTSL